MGKEIIKFLEGLSGEEEAGVLYGLRKLTQRWPLNHEQMKDAGLMDPTSPPSPPAELAAIARHAEAVAVRDEVLARMGEQYAELRRLRSRGADGTSVVNRPWTPEDQSAADRIETEIAALREELEDAGAAEVKMRPWNQDRKPERKRGAYESIGRIFGGGR